MKYLDLYLDKIRQNLPPRNREDILKEISSTLMDMIEDRNPNPGEKPSDELVKDVLREFGSPRKVAVQYGARNYLIGPSMFPIYLQVLKIVLIVVATFNMVGLIVAIVSQTGFDSGMLEAIMQVVGSLLSSLFTAFGVVTLSFAGIERTTPDDMKVKVNQKWDPDDLLKEESQDQIKVFELALEITFSMIFIVLINFFLDKIGIYFLDSNGWTSTPILNENFLRYIPAITIYIILDIAVDLYLLNKGAWDKLATGAKILINMLKIAVNFAILTGPAILTIQPNVWQRIGEQSNLTVETINRYINLGLDIVLGLAIFGLVVETIKLIYKGFIKGTKAQIEIDA
jgi:hypothetical protein